MVEVEILSDWAITLESTKLHEHVIACSAALCDPDAIGNQSISSLSALLRATHCSANALGVEPVDLFDAIFLRMKALLHDWASIEEWAEWRNALDVAEGRYTEEKMEMFREAAGIFCENEVEVILDNASSPDEANDFASELRSLAEAWDIDFNHFRSSQGRQWQQPHYRWRHCDLVY